MGLTILNRSGSVSEAMTIKKAQGFDRPLSKALQENNTYRIFFSLDTFDTSDGQIQDIWAAAIAGRSCDAKELKCAFLPLDNCVQDEFGKIQDNSAIKKYARIAKVMHEGAYRAALQAAKREAEQLANDNGEPVDTLALQRKQMTLDQEYHGAVVNDKPVPAKYNPVIGNNNIFTYVSVVLVPMMPDGSPTTKVDAIERVAFDVSKKKYEEIRRAIDRLTPAQRQHKYLELIYVYNGKDKQEAGRNAAFEYTPESSELATAYPDWWGKHASKITDKLIYDQAAILSRNRNVANPPTELEVINNFKSYMSRNKNIINYFDTEAPITRSAVEDLLEIDAVRASKAMYTKLQEIAEEKRAANAVPEETPDMAEPSSDDLATMSSIGEAKSLSDIVSQAGGIDEFDRMAGEVPVDEPGEL